jgi:hypothetical protein
MSIKQTNKLFHDKYVYKICVNTTVAYYFREKLLEKIKLTLQLKEIDFANSDRVYFKVGGLYSKTHATLDDYRLGLEIVNILENSPNYKLRIEGRFLSIYTNDETLIDSISNLSSLHIRDIWKPIDDKSKEFLLTGPRAIIRKNYTHKYKVSIKGLRNEAENFRDWAKKLPKIKLTGNSYRWGDGYFYVEDLKTLSICRLFLGDKVTKVEELVTVSEI